MVDVNTELGDIDHLVDGVVRPVLDPLDVGLHLTQHGVKRTVAETLDKWLHEAGNVRLHGVEWLVMGPTRNNVGLHRILKWVVQFMVMTLHKVVTLFYQGMSGFVVQSWERRRGFTDNTVMWQCMELLQVRWELIL